MRILVIADIHANWPALQTVISQPHDVCLCLGDLVDYGPAPAPCVCGVGGSGLYVGCSDWRAMPIRCRPADTGAIARAQLRLRSAASWHRR